MSKTIAVFGAGPGMGRSVARRFGREGFQVALVARNQARLDAYTAELAADRIQAAGFAGDLADRGALPGMIEAITARFGPIDVVEYAPSGLDLLNHATAVRDADAASFEFPLDLLLRTPVTLIRQVLPGMLERGDGVVLFGLPVNASMPAPPFGNIGTAAAAARHYLRTLYADLAGTGVYAGLLQITGPVGDSDAGIFVLENYDPALLPEPQNPADLAEAMWDLYLKRDRVRPSLRSMTPTALPDMNGEGAMAYGHAERNLALLRRLEGETQQLLENLNQPDAEQSAWLQEVTSRGDDR